MGPLIAISIMAGCWYFFLNMKPKVVMVKKPEAETSSQPTPEPVAQQYVFLDDLKETEIKVGYGVLGKHGAGPERSGSPAFVNGIKPEHSLCPHPSPHGTSLVSYTLNGKYSVFSGTATVADNAGQESLKFHIKGDGKSLWQSRVIETGKDADEFRVSLDGINKLELEIECPGTAGGAWGMWVSPRLSGTSIPATQDKANSPGVANSAQQEVFRQFQGVYQDGWACWYLFAVNAEGKVEGFQAGTDRISLIEGTIKNGEFNSKWTQTRSNYAHDFTYQLLPDLNISLSGTFGLPSGRQNHGKSVAIRVTDNNRCLRILDMANSLAKTEQEKSVLSRLRLPYLPPLYAAKSNPIVPTKVTGTQPKGIPSDATYFNSKWYRVYEDKKNWTEARDICRSQGGQLVLVPDDATQTFIKKLSGGKMLWLGATDEKQEGEWLWVDGTKMSYNYFHPVEPNNVSRIEHYLVINFRNIDGFWCDFPDKVSEVVGYICEWPDKPVVLPEEKDLSVIAVASPKTVAAAQPLTVPSTNRIFSDFEKDADGWIGINNKNEPENLIHESGGAISSSKKYISVSERGGDGNLCFFAAPAKYLGDKKSTYRGNIQLYIRQAANSSFWSPYGLIVLKSKGNELQYRINQPPSSTAWSNFDISLCENAGWVDIATGSNVTKEKFLEVLGLIESLWVLAEYSGNKYDWAGLDDFTLNDRDKSVSLEKVQDIVGTWNYSSSVVMEIKPDGKIYSNSKLTGKWSQRDKITEYYIVRTDGSTHIGTIDKYKRMLSIASRARGVGQSMARIDNGPTKNFDVPNQIMAWRMEFNNLKQDITSMEARLQVTRRSAAEYWHKHHEAKALGRLSRWNIQAEQAENAARGIEQNIKDHHTLVEKIQIKLGGN